MNLGDFTPRANIDETNDRVVGHRGTTTVSGVKPESRWSWTTIKTWILTYVAPLSHVSDDGNPHGVTQAQVGLDSVNNTSDAAKPVSTAQAAALALKLATSLKGTASGLAELDSGGKVPFSQMPDVGGGHYLGAVNNQTEMLLLDASRGDTCTRVDLDETWLLFGDTPTILGDWRSWDYPVTSVAGRTGNISLAPVDVGLGNANNTSDAAKPVSTAQAAAIAAIVQGQPKVSVPASAGAAGVAGQYAIDANYRYECVGTNTWVRTALSDWS